MWSFIPPGAPHRGGVYERLIGSAKRFLTTTFEKDKLDVETFVTVLAEVEAIMNRWPLLKSSSDPRDIDVLSPSDFLYPGIESYSSVSILAPEPPGPDALRYSWKTARHIIDGFWKRWSSEYVSSLQARSKWNAMKDDIHIGQMFLITDEAPRDQ